MRTKQCHRLIYFCGLITRDEVDNTLRKWCGCANELLTSLAVLVLILTTGFMEHSQHSATAEIHAQINILATSFQLFRNAILCKYRTVECCQAGASSVYLELGQDKATSFPRTGIKTKAEVGKCPLKRKKFRRGLS